MTSMTTTTDCSLETRIRHDRFAAMSYEKRTGPKGTVKGIDLGGHFVFKWLVEEVWDHACASVIAASQCHFYSTEDLFNDPERWVVLSKPLHIAAGRCIAHFANHKMLPLHCVNPGKKNKLYIVTRK